MFIFVSSCVLFYCVCIAVLHTLVAGLLARSQYPEGPATGHLDASFSWFPCVYKRMLRWFQYCQLLLHASHVALQMFPNTPSCYCMLSCSPPDGSQHSQLLLHASHVALQMVPNTPSCYCMLSCSPPDGSQHSQLLLHASHVALQMVPTLPVATACFLCSPPDGSNTASCYCMLLM